MRHGLLVAIGLLAAAGCCGQPMRVHSDSHITLSGPVSAKVSAELQTRTNTGPLVEMTVAESGTCSSGDARSPYEPCTSLSKVALLDVDGLLVNANLVGPFSAGENPVDFFREKLDAVAADPNVCAVVVRINSPGGGVAATDLMWHELTTFRQESGLPVVAYLIDVATGGGYYLATAADMIYAHPAAVTGGIGVILNVYNLQDTMAQFNVLCEPIKAGENIDMGSSAHALTPQAKQWLQEMADEFHGRFKSVVLSRRCDVAADEISLFSGRVFTAEQARRRGLIDSVGYLEDAIQAALGSSGSGQTRVVMFRRENDPARTPFAVSTNAPQLSKLLPVSVPGLERSRLPTFLYLWQLEPTLERSGGQ